MPIIELSLSEIPVETLYRVRRENVSLVLYSTGGRVTAFLDVCPHAAWPLSEGELEQHVVECPGHGWQFSMTSGRCLNAPAYCLTPVQVEIQGDKVRLELNQQPAENAR